MFFIVLVILLLLLSLIGFAVSSDAKGKIKSHAAETPKDRYGQDDKEKMDNAKDQLWGGRAVVALVVIVIGLSALLFSYNKVPAGHVGVVYNFGAIQSKTGAGAQFIPPWQSLKVANIQTQKYQFDLNAFSSETQDVFITATLNYAVAPADILPLYRNVGPDYFNKLVPQRVNQAFKDETVKFKATEIAPNRETIRLDVLARLKKDLAQYSINVQDLNIDNISFSKAFTTAIEDKQIATQQAQAAQNRVATAKYRAQQIIEAAQGQAKANILKRQTLTPLLVEQNAIDKLNPRVTVIMVPSNGNFLLPNLIPTTK